MGKKITIEEDKTRINYDKVCNDILELCKSLGYAPSFVDIKKYGINITKKYLDEYLKSKTKYNNFHDLCRSNGYKFQNDLVVNGKFIDSKELTLEDVKILFNEYKNKYGKYPNSMECTAKEKDNLPKWHRIQNIIKEENISLNEFFNYIGDFESIKPEVDKYYDYIKIIKEQCELQNRVLSYNDFNKNTWGLTEARWVINHCPDKNVKNFNQFIVWLGYTPYSNISKERATEVILEMQLRFNRPLMYDDFRTPNIDTIGIGTINKIWGSLNKMKKELGLEIVQEDMTCKKLNFDKAKVDIIKLCNYIYETENRKLITSGDTKKIEGMLNFGTYRNCFKNNGINIRDFISCIGFELLKDGTGLKHTFEDGEVTKSKYELQFTKYIRDKLNLKYNIDYQRDIRYRTFIEDYKGLMDCDYVISYQGRIIYIEIAGLLRDHHKYFYENKELTNSKAKEKYRQKLMQKEKMLKENNLEYYIIFPINKNYESILDYDLIDRIFNI